MEKQSRETILAFLNSLSEEELNTLITKSNLENSPDVSIKRKYNMSFRRIIFCLVGEQFELCYKVANAILKYGQREFDIIPIHTTESISKENNEFHIFCGDDEFRSIYKNNIEKNTLLSYCNMDVTNCTCLSFITGNYQYMMVEPAIGKNGNLCILSPAGLDSLEKNIEHFNLPYRLYVVYPTLSLYDQLIQIEEKKQGKAESDISSFCDTYIKYDYGNLIKFFIDGRFDVLEMNEAIPELEIYETFIKIKKELEIHPPEMNGARINTEILLCCYS